MSVKVVGTIDGFQLPTQIRGWVKRLDDARTPICLRFIRNNFTFLEAVPNIVRGDIVPDPDILSGFVLELPGTDDLLDMLLGRAVLVVESDGAEASEATIWNHGRAVCLAQILQHQLLDAPTASRDVVATVAAGVDRNLPLRSMLDRILDDRLGSAATMLPDPAALVLSNMPVAAGTPSMDGTAVVGEDGWLFLVGGSNDLLSRYRRGSDDVVEHKRTAEAWIDLHRRRVERYARPNRCFLQMIVLEKTSALSAKLPFAIESPTYCLGKIERTLADDPNYLSVASLVPSIGTERFYRRTDTHPSAEGNFAIIRGIARRLGMLEVIDDLEVRFDASHVEVGDLAQRFFGVPILESLSYPTSPQLEPLQPTLKSSFGVNRRTQSGTFWRTPNAPLDLKLVVFGNSVFEHGETPLNLSWWCVRLFREFYFFWQSETLPDTVDEIGADVVIAQTVERFLFVDPPPI